MTDRRGFLKQAAVGSAALMAPAVLLRSSGLPTNYYSPHPFILDNPDAVFIMRTSVGSKTDTEAKKQAGLAFGRSVFKECEYSASAFHKSHAVAIKPNLTCRNRTDPNYTIEGTMGIITDSWFVEGVIGSLAELGVAGANCHIVEVNCPADFADGGYTAMAGRTGARLFDLSNAIGSLDNAWITWKNVPNGVWFKRIPYLYPVNSPNSWLLNISKFKAHSMGITLTAKNIQGTIAHNYQAHCLRLDETMDIATSDIQPGAKEAITANFNRHKAAGIPRWDKPEPYGGLWMETWASRCLDNNSVNPAGLHVVEGIYGRDGNFIYGPGTNGLARDFMTNVIIFGKNQFHVDTVGHWLAGHEPGNFGLFHLARERGMSRYLNPMEIPVYDWRSDGTAVRKQLTDFTRTNLLTCYLQKNYGGSNETYWHMVNEPYRYSTGTGEILDPSPEVAVLEQNRPNPFNFTTDICYSLPENGMVSVDVLNDRGQVVAVLAEGYRIAGKHLVTWNSGNSPSGLYYCRMTINGHRETVGMMLMR